MIALVARYHRKSEPRPRHLEFAALPDQDQQAVQVLAGLLRVGIGLDRTYRRVVERARVTITDTRVDVELQVSESESAELEIFAAEERAGLLSASLGREIRFRPAPS